MTTFNPSDPKTDEESFAAGLKRGEAHREAHGFHGTPPDLKSAGKLDPSQLPASMIRDAQAGGLG